MIFFGNAVPPGLLTHKQIMLMGISLDQYEKWFSQFSLDTAVKPEISNLTDEQFLNLKLIGLYIHEGQEVIRIGDIPHEVT